MGTTNSHPYIEIPPPEIIYNQSRDLIIDGFVHHYVLHYLELISESYCITNAKHISKFYQLVNSCCMYLSNRYPLCWKMADTWSNDCYQFFLNFSNCTYESPNGITKCGYRELFELYGIVQNKNGFYDLNVYCIEINKRIVQYIKNNNPTLYNPIKSIDDYDDAIKRIYEINTQLNTQQLSQRENEQLFNELYDLHKIQQNAERNIKKNYSSSKQNERYRKVQHLLKILVCDESVIML